MKLKSTPIILFFLVCTLGCSTRGSMDALNDRWLPFLEDGATKKLVILSRLGRPSAQFQKGRIFTYRLQMDHQNVLRAVSQDLDEFVIDRKLYGEDPMYSLVLIFDNDDILKQHRLVEVLP